MIPNGDQKRLLFYLNTLLLDFMATILKELETLVLTRSLYCCVSCVSRELTVVVLWRSLRMSRRGRAPTSRRRSTRTTRRPTR
jgi:hypothetical protein